MNLAVRLDPAVEVTSTVDTMTAGESHTVGTVTRRVGGKGVNVARPPHGHLPGAGAYGTGLLWLAAAALVPGGLVDNVIGEDATLADVVQRFVDGPRRHLIVLDREGRCAGVVGPRHVAQARSFDARRDEEISVKELGCAPWIALSPLDDMRICAQTLVENDVDAIPVLDGDQRILGLVTAHDIARAVADVATSRHVFRIE